MFTTNHLIRKHHLLNRGLSRLYCVLTQTTMLFVASLNGMSVLTSSITQFLNCYEIFGEN